MKNSGIRILFYSGDTDGVVPTYGTKQWIKSLGWETKRYWRPWLTEGQVSGYIKEYDHHLNFATVKGVGHLPTYEHLKLSNLVLSWLHNESI